MKVGIISLGCAKNLVDSETIAYLFQDNQIEIVNSVEEADIILINTCGFIESSKQESIDTILEIVQYHKITIVTGCLVERYKEELEKEIPEVDLFISIREYPHFSELLNQVLKNKKLSGTLSNNNRILSTQPFTAYLKISEGCNNCCAYCAIPLIRGKFRSFPQEELVSQAAALAQKGVKELVVISQDTTRYGEDLKNTNIVSLLKELLSIKEFEYIRLLYLYPDEINDELIELIGSNPRLTPYFDIPIQHASSKVLQSMNRRDDEKFLRELFSKIRNKVPNAILRTTLIVGFPGETEEDFAILENFVKDIRFDHLGTFTYSKEEGTVGDLLPNQIDERIKQERYQRIMEIQQKISYENNQKRLGKQSYGLIVGYDEDRNAYLVRSEFNAPDEIDGNIYCFSENEHSLGDKIFFEIINAENYDLYGKIITL